MHPEWPLLRTKLYPPSIPSEYVVRTELIDSLDNKRHLPITLISAGAGYGKSTLISSWLEMCQCPSIWYSLDENDDELEIFLSYLITAIENQFNNSLSYSKSLLGGANLPELLFIAQNLLNELDQIESEFILVLDDYYKIKNEKIHDLIDIFIQYPPEKMHLCLITRYDPPLKLNKLRSYGRLHDIRNADLVFSSEEISLLFEKIANWDIGNEKVEVLRQVTDGWVTGLRLAAMTLGEEQELSNLLSRLDSESSPIADFLIEEAFNKQEKDAQKYLLLTSLFNRFCPELIDHLLDIDPASSSRKMKGLDFIRELFSKNLFIIPLDREGNWVRYHHLFQSNLQKLANRSLDAKQIANYHIRGSLWFAENGLIDEALDHALKGGDKEGAAKIVEDNRGRILNDDTWYLLDSWLNKLPEDLIQQHEGLLLARVWTYGKMFRHADMLPIIEKLLVMRQEDQTSPLRGEIDFFLGYFNYFAVEEDVSESLLKNSLRLISKDLYYAYAEAQLHYSLAVFKNGRYRESIDYLENLIKETPAESGFLLTRLWCGLAFANLMHNNFADALKQAKEFNKIATNHKLRFSFCWAKYIEALIYYWQNDLTAAEKIFSELATHPHILHRRKAIDTFAGLVAIYDALHQPEKAEKSLQNMLDFAKQINQTEYLDISKSVQAGRSLNKNKLAKEQFSIDTDLGMMLWWLELPRISQCRLLIADGCQTSLSEALVKLNSYETENIKVNNKLQLIVVYTMQSIAFEKKGETDKAFIVLQKAIELAEPSGIIRPFISLGDSMAQLLKKLKKQQFSQPFISNIIRCIEDELKHKLKDLSINPKKSFLFKNEAEISIHLTRREQEVVQHIALGLRNREIAEKLHVSEDTIKKHTYNLFIKMDVHNRLSLVEKARKTGIID